MRSISMDSEFGEITIVNEPAFTFGSADNARHYPLENNLQTGEWATSVHGVLLNDEPLAVFGASGGCSTVHKHSALVLSTKLYLAVGDRVVCFGIKGHRLEWSTVVDSATCFGVHYESKRGALISHGELEIARLDKDGAVLWSSSGADVFSESFGLEREFIAVVDFGHREYHISYETGAHI